MRCILFAGFFLIMQFVIAQNISGYVYDSKSNRAIIGASVYFDGSTMGMITNEEGKFSISYQNRTNAKLVVSHIGYKKQILDFPISDAPIKIGLVTEPLSLNEVIVSSDPFSRKQKLNIFRLEFLGETRGGKNSKILNEDSIRLRYDVKEKTLLAYSDVPLIIINEYLGYRISFSLQEFEIKFRQMGLERLDNIIHTLIKGTSFFMDFTKDDPVVTQRRKKAFLGSPIHFMRTCLTREWDKEGFIIRVGLKRIDRPEELLRIHWEDSFAKIRLDENISITHDGWRSTLSLLDEKEFGIDGYGNYVEGTNVLLGGHMSELRLGDLLPLDFEVVALGD